MALKLTSKQLGTLAVLETFPHRFDSINRLIEEVASLKADVTQVRRLTRTLDEMKIAAQSIGENGLADSLGIMATISRRTGGTQTRIRGLREGYGSLKIHFEQALKAASTPIAEAEEENETPATPPA